MAIVRQFSALRPLPEKAEAVSSVPYDVVNTEEARTLAKGNPLSFLHVIRPEIDLPEGTDLYADSVYEKAKDNLAGLIEREVLIKEDKPSIYLYRLVMGGHEQTGIACCLAADEYDNNTIKKHEHTRKEKEDDRLRHILTLSAHAGPVLLTYRGLEKIDAIIAEEVQKEPLYDFVAEDGIRHVMWRVADYERIVDAFREVPSLYIADGHHRAACASRVKKEMITRYGKENGDEEYNYFLAVLFSKDELVILPYNRWVSDLGGIGEEEFLKEVQNRFELRAAKNPEPEQRGVFNMYLQGKWYELHPRKKVEEADPVKRLDLSLFQGEILEPLLGITNQRKDKRIDFVGGEDSAQKLKRLVDTKGGVAFSFYPVSIEELLAVSDAGLSMPPKSTWFVPKLRSGLLIHQF